MRDNGNCESISKLGGKILKTTVVTIFLCLLMNVSFGVLSQAVGNMTVLNQIFDILLIIVMLFGILSDSATADANMHSIKKTKIDYKRGFIAGIYALIPFYLISLPVLVLKIIGSSVFSSYLIVARMLNAPFTVLYQNIFAKTGLSDVSYWQISLLFLVPLIFVVVCGVSYILGTKKFSLSEKLIYKNK